MKVIAIIQARVGSSRLPGKVLADLDGAPMIDRVIQRAGAASRVSEVWVASSDLPADDQLADHCRAAGVPVARGPERDVLARFRLAAAMAEADVVVRLTGDCPLLDPTVIDRVIAEVTSQYPRIDYAANVLERSFPRGLDTEAFTVAALERMDRLGQTPASREHVTLGPRSEDPGAFTVRSVRAAGQDSDLRWTVDTAEDLAFVRDLYQALGLGTGIRPYLEVVRWCREHRAGRHSDRRGTTWDPLQAPTLVTRGS